MIRRATESMLKTPGLANTVGLIGWSVLTGTSQSNAGTIFAVLEPFEKRRADPKRYADAIAKALGRSFAGIQDAYVAVFPPPPVRGMSSVGGFKMQVQDRADLDLQALQAATENLIAAGSQQPELAGLFTSFRANAPQFYLDLDRTKAKSMEVALSDIFDTLQIYLGSLYVNDLNLFGRTYQVTAQADARFRLKPEDIAELKTRNANGEMVPLGTLVGLKQVTGPETIYRYNRYRAVDIIGQAAPGHSSGEAAAAMEQVAKQSLPPGYGYEWTELTYQQILAGNTAVLIFPLCVLFVFLTFAAQYESWSLPLAVILIVPMCLLFAIAGVWLRDMDNNIFTQAGLVVLVGLASKNAILWRRRTDELSREIDLWYHDAHDPGGLCGRWPRLPCT